VRSGLRELPFDPNLDASNGSSLETEAKKKRS
jgi:hypothetical protein